MLSPFKMSLAEWDSARLGTRRMHPYAGVCCTAAKWLLGHSYSLHGRIAMLRMFCCVFALEFLFNPQFDLEPDYIIRKPLFSQFQRYIVRREILSTFHTRVDNRSICHFCIVFTPNCPFPFDDHHQNLIHPYGHTEPDPTHHRKRHPDPITRVATAHMWGPTDGTSESSIPWALRSMERRAKNMILH